MNTYQACTKICFALSEALVVVAARTLAASFSSAWSWVRDILPNAPVVWRASWLGPILEWTPPYIDWYSDAALSKNMVMSSVSLEEEWTLSVSRGYGEAATRALIWLGRRGPFSEGLAMLWLGGIWWPFINTCAGRKKQTYRIILHEVVMTKIIGSPVKILCRWSDAWVHPIDTALRWLRTGVGRMSRVGWYRVGSGMGMYR